MTASVFGIVIGGFSLFFAALNFWTISGLRKGSTWAWYVAMVLAIMYLPSGFFLFGAGILFPLISADARKVFKIG